MSNVIQILSSGLVALGSAPVRLKYPRGTRTPFADDRRALNEDWRQVRQDMAKCEDRIRKENDSKTRGR